MVIVSKIELSDLPAQTVFHLAQRGEAAPARIRPGAREARSPHRRNRTRAAMRSNCLNR